MGQNSIMIAVGRAVDHVCKNFLAASQGVPKQLENASGHFRMADDAVRLSRDFLFCVTGHPKENAVGVGDVPLEVGLADDNLIIVEKKRSTPVRLVSLGMVASV